MRYIFITILLFKFFTFYGQKSFAESNVYNNNIYNDKIKTVQLYMEGWNLSYPVIKLKDREKLVLHFDLLDNQAESYYYTFIHCDKDWKKSDIFTNIYLDGYPENPIEKYERSFNTTVGYYHYQVSFPNDRITFNLSGNYVVIVYPAGQPEEPVLTQRFVISEDAVRINISSHRPLTTKENDTYQQIDFTVSYPGLSLNDPQRNVYATILQNGRWDNAKTNLKADFIGNNELKYNSLSDINIFKGGNEFRYFDIKSIHYQSEFIRKIEYTSPNYNVFLTPSESREFKPYFFEKEFNGKYFIAIQEGKKFDTDADYLYVYFTLVSKQIIPGGSIYISGGLNNWIFDKNNLMTYNQSRGEYECTMLLKQGWYNYEYAFLKDRSNEATSEAFEGSHYETENDYLVFIYYRNPAGRYDRVIGTVTSNTLNKSVN